MKHALLASLVIIMGTVLSGCSKPAAPPAAPPAASQPAPPRQPIPTITKDNQGILTDSQRDGLNGANQVSGVLQKADEEQRKKMKEQGL